MLRVIAAAVVLLGLLVLVWMNLLRVNNLEYDVKVLQEEVARLKGAAPTGAGPAPHGAAPPPSTPAAFDPSPAALPPATAAAAGPPREPGVPFEVRPAGFLDEDRPEQMISFPSGPAVRGAEVSILAVEGEGAGERVLPEPITATLQPGLPHAVAGICQGGESAAWVLTLQPGGLRLTSRDCEYPVRGLRPRLRINLLR